MSKFLYTLFVLSTILMFTNCKHSKESIDRKHAVSQDFTEYHSDEYIQTEKDSIDLLIEKRAHQKLNLTIFAGLRFGDSHYKVERQIGKYDNKSRKVNIPIGDKIKVMVIEDYEAVYYNGRLASLTLFTDDDYLYNACIEMYSIKYGETKHGHWVYADCEIEISIGHREEYNIAQAIGYTSHYQGGEKKYYKSFTGNRTSSLTNDYSFMRIVYKNYDLLKMLKQQQIQTDSIENAKRLEALEKEKELARKLRTNPSSQI